MENKKKENKILVRIDTDTGSEYYACDPVEGYPVGNNDGLYVRGSADDMRTLAERLCAKIVWDDMPLFVSE